MSRGTDIRWLGADPIDIRNEDLTFVERLPALGFSYRIKVAPDGFNNGSAAEFARGRAEVSQDGGELTVVGTSTGRCVNSTGIEHRTALLA